MDICVCCFLNRALKQLLVKFPCGCRLPECWCGHLPPGRSHTWERQKQNVVEIWNVVRKFLHHRGERFSRQLRLCCFMLYSHKEETCAHMVGCWTHPNVPMFLKVLWSYDCQDIRTTFIKQCLKIIPCVIKSRLFVARMYLKMYLHREQCSLSCCFAETWLPLAVPETSREYSMRQTWNKTRCPCTECI